MVYQSRVWLAPYPIEAVPRMNLEVVCEQMARVPEWAKGLSLRADGYICDFYKKD